MAKKGKKRRGKAWGPSNPLWRWQHRGGKKMKKRRGTSRRRGNPGNPGNSRRGGVGKAITGKLGTAYQSAKFSVQLASPVTTEIAVRGFSREALNGIRARIDDQAHRSAYLRGMAVGTLDAYASRRFKVAGALSRGSVTAIAPEVYAGLQAAASSSGLSDIQQLNRTYTFVTSGYDPLTPGFPLADSRIATYHFMKWGGVALRMARSRSAFLGKVLNPVSKALNAVGLSI